MDSSVVLSCSVILLFLAIRYVAIAATRRRRIPKNWDFIVDLLSSCGLERRVVREEISGTEVALSGVGLLTAVRGVSKMYHRSADIAFLVTIARRVVADISLHRDLFKQ
jgi:hypothetical protein